MKIKQNGKSGVIMNSILKEDIENIFQSINKNFFKDSTILLTGAAGFLGYYFVNFFIYFKDDLNIKKIICLDNLLTNQGNWLFNLEKENKKIVEIHKFNVISDSIASIPIAKFADIIIHMASIASPTFYRKYPIETLDANIWGLRKLFDFYKDKSLRSFLFFSSSEIYGDPPNNQIPTKEDYRGNVATIGPRACYDEAKRFGETLSYLFAEKYKMPIVLARPFNNFGPGMNLNDKRVPADFAKAVFDNKKIEIFSDGNPTRTFCYISDAITGYLKILHYAKFDVFNIGIDKPEISIKELAEIYVQEGKILFNYDKEVILTNPPEENYLTHNPNRRCPSIEKARKLLDYNPQINVYEGVNRFLTFIKQNNGEL